ncbi:hypothetical protein OOK60_17250 [Trichothermofontia sichuanensis B231]|uniref:hypothetical protein n=1 Tax=Trichothermofontia sichuanensis TaxID=3045816 RepID=UPI002245C13E|nr:hypothetical protein [Trichothermofontia sichuanensis]UZQ54207.1 hypothetical protein OOK60_17250 [Trichothermofontia sichuanensis B231]
MKWQTQLGYRLGMALLGGAAIASLAAPAQAGSAKVPIDSAGIGISNIINRGGILNNAPGFGPSPTPRQQGMNENINNLLQPNRAPFGRTVFFGSAGPQRVDPNGQVQSFGQTPTEGFRTGSASSGNVVTAQDVVNGLVRQAARSSVPMITPEVAALFTGTVPTNFAQQLVTPVALANAPTPQPTWEDRETVIAAADQLTTAVTGLVAPERRVTIAEVNQGITAYNQLIGVMALQDPAQLESFPHLNSVGVILSALRQTAS